MGEEAWAGKKCQPPRNYAWATWEGNSLWGDSRKIKTEMPNTWNTLEKF